MNAGLSGYIKFTHKCTRREGNHIIFFFFCFYIDEDTDEVDACIDDIIS